MPYEPCNHPTIATASTVNGPGTELYCCMVCRRWLTPEQVDIAINLHKEPAKSDALPERFMADKPTAIRRTGPRFTVWVDLNLQWLRPDFKYEMGIGYLHLGWVSFAFGNGKGRDALWDTFDRGLPGETK